MPDLGEIEEQMRDMRDVRCENVFRVLHTQYSRTGTSRMRCHALSELEEGWVDAEEAISAANIFLFDVSGF